MRDDNSTFNSLGVLGTLDYGVWLYDFDHCAVIWANKRALTLWRAETLEELRARDLSADMSPTVRMRLNQYKQDFLSGKTDFHESWTLYPHGAPVHLQVRFSGVTLDDGRIALRCEAMPSRALNPDSVRSIDALLHTVDMVSLFTSDGALLYCNPAARKSFGSEQVASGATPTEAATLANRFVDPADAETLMVSLKETGRADMVAEVVNANARTWHRISAARCHDPITGDWAYLITEQDVTETELTKRELEASRNQALQASRAKSDFLAVMSHELRTPLNGILGVAEILRDQHLTDEQLQLVAVLLQSGQDLLATLNGILDLAKIEAETISVADTPFDISDVVGKVASIHKSVAREKGIALSATLDAATGARRGDPQLLTQILHNLFSNAIKFTEVGSVSLVVDTSAPGHIAFCVADTGIGLNDEQIARVPNAFEQADNSISRRYGGTGLGLTIVHKLIHAMQGDIQIKSRPNEGTEITVTLPFPMEEQVARSAAPVAMDRQPITARALIVDDVPTNLMLLRIMLEQHGISVTTAKSGYEALRLIGEEPFDILMCDIAMPEMDGVTTLRQIREKETENGLDPVLAVAVTANAFDHQIQDYLGAGFEDYLSKPITTDSVNRLMAVLSTRAPAAGVAQTGRA